MTLKIYCLYISNAKTEIKKENSTKGSSEWNPGVGDGQGGLACCDSWGRKESDATEQLNRTELMVPSWRRKWQPSPVFLPGESHEQRSLQSMGRQRVGHYWATKQQQMVPFCSDFSTWIKTPLQLWILTVRPLGEEWYLGQFWNFIEIKTKNTFCALYFLLHIILKITTEMYRLGTPLCVFVCVLCLCIGKTSSKSYVSKENHEGGGSSGKAFEFLQIPIIKVSRGTR